MYKAWAHYHLLMPMLLQKWMQKCFSPLGGASCTGKTFSSTGSLQLKLFSNCAFTDTKYAQSCSNLRSIKIFSCLLYPYETVFFQGDFLCTWKKSTWLGLCMLCVVPLIRRLMAAQCGFAGNSGSWGEWDRQPAARVKFGINTPEGEICETSQRASNSSNLTMHIVRELCLPFQDKRGNQSVTAESGFDWYLALQLNLIFFLKRSLQVLGSE